MISFSAFDSWNAHILCAMLAVNAGDSAIHRLALFLRSSFFLCFATCLLRPAIENTPREASGSEGALKELENKFRQRFGDATRNLTSAAFRNKWYELHPPQEEYFKWTPEHADWLNLQAHPSKAKFIAQFPDTQARIEPVMFRKKVGRLKNQQGNCPLRQRNNSQGSLSTTSSCDSSSGYDGRSSSPGSDMLNCSSFPPLLPTIETPLLTPKLPREETTRFNSIDQSMCEVHNGESPAQETPGVLCAQGFLHSPQAPTSPGLGQHEDTTGANSQIIDPHSSSSNSFSEPISEAAYPASVSDDVCSASSSYRSEELHSAYSSPLSLGAEAALFPMQALQSANNNLVSDCAPPEGTLQWNEDATSMGALNPFNASQILIGVDDLAPPAVSQVNLQPDGDSPPFLLNLTPNPEDRPMKRQKFCNDSKKPGCEESFGSWPPQSHFPVESRISVLPLPLEKNETTRFASIKKSVDEKLPPSSVKKLVDAGPKTSIRPQSLMNGRILLVYLLVLLITLVADHLFLNPQYSPFALAVFAFAVSMLIASSSTQSTEDNTINSSPCNRISAVRIEEDADCRTSITFYLQLATLVFLSTAVFFLAYYVFVTHPI